jgi:ABC-type transport system substrate-binding protein
LLNANGFNETGSVLTGPGGQAVDLSLSVDPGDSVAQQLAEQVVTSCAAIGIEVRLVEERSGVQPAGWQMAIETRQVPASASRLASRYVTRGAANVDGYSSPAMNVLAAQIPKAPAAALPALYGAVDALAWKDFVDVPLVQVPVIVASSSNLLNVAVGPFWAALAWDEEDWGIAAS